MNWKKSEPDKWNRTRREWIKRNPPSHEGYWYCVVGGGALDKYAMTLDHDIPRGRAPYLRHDLSNLNPMCQKHNFLKGSKSLEEYRATKYDKRCY